MFSGDFPGQFPAALPGSTLYETLPPSMIMEEDHVKAGIIMYNIELLPRHDHYELVNNNCSLSSSGCESSPSNSAVQVDETKPMNSCLFQRSISSHSLPAVINKNVINNCGISHTAAAADVSLGGTQHRLVDLIDSCTVRRVFSTGDLQLQMHQQSHHHRLSESPLSNESSSSSIIEGMLSKACRYSPEEKKERIERYKTKRTQRNFNKKIKYACRKTLADSRPRIRGRFARNNSNEDDESTVLDQEQHHHYNCGQVLEWGNREQQYEERWEDNNEQDEDDNCWVDLFNAAWSTA
uniref:CCT domain-containing protein n=1 Tax=Kalanchoe fedtschenkoi TaxID=63787 RepID=A0A7N0TCJ2_KALFE